MRPLKTLVAASLMVTAVAVATPVSAQGDKVLARVDGSDITEADVSALRAQFGAALNNVPETERDRLNAELVQFIIETRLISTAAAKEKLGESEEFKRRLDLYRQRAMREYYLEKKARNEVKEDDARKFYDERVGSIKPETEVRARHIVVETEQDAHEVIERLGRGADFGELAKEKSKAPSKFQGGDLGYFTAAQAPKEFAEAVFSLNKGDVSEPIETPQGWNVVKLEDKREKKPPAFDDVKAEIIQALVQQKEQEVMQGLRSGAKVEIVDPAIDKAMKAPRGSFSQ